MASASAGVYQRTSEARISPWRWASARENTTSVPHAVLSLYFFANSYALPMPGQTSSALARSTEPSGKPCLNSSGSGCKLSQTPFSAISLAVASSMRNPCSIHFTPTAIARWIAAGVKACATTYVPQFSAASTAARNSGSVKVTASIGHPAARRQLDLGRPLHELLARAHAHLVGTIRDHTAADLLHAGEHAADRSLPEVAMAAGDRDHGAG